eukprot:7405384-Pyramimonas_sp.AAC.1
MFEEFGAVYPRAEAVPSISTSACSLGVCDWGQCHDPRLEEIPETPHQKALRPASGGSSLDPCFGGVGNS